MDLYKEFELYEHLWPVLTEEVSLETLPTKPGIYCIIFDNRDAFGKTINRKYVGLAQNIQNRIREHLKAARPDGRDYVVYNAMRKHPYKVIALEILDTPDIKRLAELEKQWIAELHTYIYDTTESSDIKIVEYNGRNYPLSCSGPGYNMTPGGEGAPVYTKEVIDEIIELYKANNYSHVKTYKDFKDKYKDRDKYKKLSYATLQLFVEAAGLPWNNELNKKTFVFACIDTKKRVQEGDRMRDKLAVEANTSDLKYRIECESQAQADALVDHIWSRFKNDHETEFKAYLATRSKREREAPGAMRIKWMIEHGLYDEYLDLSQYDLSTIKIPKKSLGGEGSSGWKIASRGGFLGILYNSESTDDQKVEELLETTFSYTP
jgi:hypothetical protein